MDVISVVIAFLFITPSSKILQWNPVNTDTKGTRLSVHIKRVKFREVVRVFPRRDKRNCPQYPGVRIKRGSTVYLVASSTLNKLRLDP